MHDAAQQIKRAGGRAVLLPCLINTLITVVLKVPVLARLVLCIISQGTETNLCNFVGDRWFKQPLPEVHT